MDTVDAIHQRLQNSPGGALDLLPVYQAKEYEELWRQEPRLFRQFTGALIKDGHPTRAFELGRDGLKSHPGDAELLYLIALALARGGNVTKSTETLRAIPDPGSLPPRLKVDVLCLGARLIKDRYERTLNPALKARYAREAAAGYLSAFQQTGDAYAGINAAAMAVLAGERKKAAELSDRVIVQVHKDIRQAGRSNDYWALATLGEAYFIKGNIPEAGAWYRKAVRAATGHTGDIAAMRRDLHLLRDKLKVSEEIWGLLNVGNVVVFAGHMIDPPGCSGRRFPNDPILVERVGRSIQEHIEDLNPTVAYCSAAWGSDIIFAERMLARERRELHVVLPFKQEDFYATSVDFGLSTTDMSHWRARFDAVLAQATEVHYATREPYLNDEILFDFTNEFIQGLALLRAAQRGVTPYALVLMDSSAQLRTGGTASFRRTWANIMGEEQTRVIPLEDLRTGTVAGPFRSLHQPRTKTSPKTDTFKRQIKAMLFADMKDFSTLEETLAPQFMQRFLSEVSKAIQSSPKKPVFRNTWGDGLYMVFDAVEHAADFAVRLMDRIEKVDWCQLGLTEITPLRIGMHAGPVYKGLDPLIRQQNYFGSHVTRTARIEPVTIPGSIFVSEQFAALLAIKPKQPFVCEFVGIEDLAKGYDRCPLYRLGRR